LTDENVEKKIKDEIKKIQEQLGATEEDMQAFRKTLELNGEEDTQAS